MGKIKVHTGPLGDVSYRDINPPAKIHVMGVCGTAMSSLAGLLKEKGYRVCGSDKAFYPPISEELEKMGIPVFKGYKAENIHKDLDLVIVGNVISKNMPEAQALLSSGLPYVSLPEAVNSFIIEKKNTAMVCGTHGKTTISFLLAWVLRECGRNPGFMIGGVSENFKTGYRLSDSSWFVLEGDEYDTAFFEKTPKCIHYQATHTILSNIEFDHADIYKDIKEVERAFQLLMDHKSSSYLVAGTDSPLVEKMLPSTRQEVVTYGVKKGDWRLIDRRWSAGEGQVMKVRNPQNEIEEMSLPLPGEHNALNALAVRVFSHLLNLDTEKVVLALKSFKGVRRRFQVLGDFSGVTLIEDFAHHPTAVSAVLRSAREVYPGRRIIALFEPRSNTSRRNIFQEDYQRALLSADLVFCREPDHVSLLSEEDRFSAKKLAGFLEKKQKKAFYAEDVSRIADLVQKQAREKDVVVIMSNGDFGGIYSLLKERLC